MSKEIKVKSVKDKKSVDYTYSKRKNVINVLPKTICIITRFAFLIYAVVFTCSFCYLILHEKAYEDIINILLVLIARKALSTTILNGVYFGLMIFIWLFASLIIFLSYLRRYLSWRSRKQTFSLSITMICVSILFIAINFALFAVSKFALIKKDVIPGQGITAIVNSSVNSFIDNYKIDTFEFISLNIIEALPLLFGFWLLYEARLIRKGVINVIKKNNKKKKPLFDKVMDGFFDFGEEYSTNEIKSAHFEENTNLTERTIEEFLPA